MSKKITLSFFVLLMLITSACVKVESQPTSNSTAKSTLTTKQIDEAVNAYFTDSVKQADDLATFLGDIGYAGAYVEIKEKNVMLAFEQFDDLLPEQMQLRYIIAFQAAERFDPLCDNVFMVVMVEGEPFIALTAACPNIRALRRAEISVPDFMNTLEGEVLAATAE